MINFKKALFLTQAYKDKVIWVREGDKRTPFSLEELKRSFDLENTIVHVIQPCFIVGDYEGFEFTIK